MNLLITGSEGYLGTQLTQHLTEHKITGIDTNYLSNRDFNYKRRHELLHKDIRDIKEKQLNNHRYDAIIHLAALSNDPAGELNPKATLEINHKATTQLAKKAKKAGVARFILSSSCSIYGGNKTSKPFTEESKPNPLTTYATSKLLAEKDLLKLSDETFTATCLRFSTLYGLSPRLRLDLVINSMTAWAYTTNEIHLFNSGNAWRPLLHIDDACKAIIHTLKADQKTVNKQIFNVGNNTQNYQVKQIAEIVNKEIPSAKIMQHNKDEKDERNYNVNFDKINQTGYTANRSIEQGIHKLYDAYKQYDLKEEDLKTSEFFTVRRYKELLENKQIDADFRWIR